MVKALGELDGGRGRDARVSARMELKVLPAGPAEIMSGMENAGEAGLHPLTLATRSATHSASCRVGGVAAWRGASSRTPQDASTSPHTRDVGQCGCTELKCDSRSAATACGPEEVGEDACGTAGRTCRGASGSRAGALLGSHLSCQPHSLWPDERREIRDVVAPVWILEESHVWSMTGERLEGGASRESDPYSFSCVRTAERESARQTFSLH